MSRTSVRLLTVLVACLVLSEQSTAQDQGRQPGKDFCSYHRKKLWPYPRVVELSDQDYAVFDVQSLSLVLLPEQEPLSGSLTSFVAGLNASAPMPSPHLGKQLPRHRQFLFIVTTENDRPLEPYYFHESYVVHIGATHMTIESASPQGVVQALATIRQLICCQDGVCVLPQGLIEDAPKFPHRGLFLDVANKPLSVMNLKMIVNLMASYKMNILHLRLNGRTNFLIETNETSGPLGSSPRVPRNLYSKEDFETLLDYSTRQGVRIIPELNLPVGTDASITWLVDCLTA